MTDCQRFREALEARRHGAPVTTTGELDLNAHLESCEECRAYEAEAVAMESALEHYSERIEGRADFDVFLRKGRWIRLRNNFAVAGWVLVLALVLYVGFTAAWFALILSLPLFGHLKEAVDEARGEKAAQALISSEGEWLEHYYKEMKRRTWSAFLDHGLGSWVQALLFLLFAFFGRYPGPCSAVAIGFFLYGTLQMFRGWRLLGECSSIGESLKGSEA